MTPPCRLLAISAFCFSVACSSATDSTAPESGHGGRQNGPQSPEEPRQDPFQATGGHVHHPCPPSVYGGLSVPAECAPQQTDTHGWAERPEMTETR